MYAKGGPVLGPPFVTLGHARSLVHEVDGLKYGQADAMLMSTLDYERVLRLANALRLAAADMEPAPDDMVRPLTVKRDAQGRTPHWLDTSERADVAIYDQLGKLNGAYGFGTYAVFGSSHAMFSGYRLQLNCRATLLERPYPYLPMTIARATGVVLLDQERALRLANALELLSEQGEPADAEEVAAIQLE